MPSQITPTCSGHRTWRYAMRPCSTFQTCPADVRLQGDRLCERCGYKEANHYA